MIVREQEIRKHKFRLGIAKSAELRTIQIKPNFRIVIKDYVDHTVPYQQTLAMLHSSTKSKLDKDIVEEPALIEYNSGLKDMDVYLSNTTTRSVTIQPKAILCDL